MAHKLSGTSTLPQIFKALGGVPLMPDAAELAREDVDLRRALGLPDPCLPLLMLDFKSFIVMAAHPMPPMSARDTQELHVYMLQIADVVRSVNKPLILVGDFNATLWSETLNELRGLHLVRANQAGWAWTWPSGFWPFAVQIDHIFVRDAVPLDFKTLPNIGSDHFPVRASVRVQTP